MVWDSIVVEWSVECMDRVLGKVFLVFVLMWVVLLSVECMDHVHGKVVWVFMLMRVVKPSVGMEAATVGVKVET